jgi:hypothetical protein
LLLTDFWTKLKGLVPIGMGGSINFDMGGIIIFDEEYLASK